MFARIVEVTAKPGQTSELFEVLSQQILPVLKQQRGFIDALFLSDAENPQQLVSLTIWSSQDAAEQYRQQQYASIVERVRPYLEQDPVFRGFNVDTSTAHRVGESKAA